MALPAMTPEQRKYAQERSLQARKARAEMLDRVKSGEQSVADVVGQAKSDPVYGKTKVTRLLKAVRGFGPQKVATVMEAAGIQEDRRLAGLGDRQREALLRAVES